MVISLSLCIYSFHPLSSILSPSILHLQATLLPTPRPPTRVSWHCGCCSSPGWSRLCYEAVGPISSPVTVSANLKVQTEEEIARVTLEVRDRWQPSRVYDPAQKLSALSRICPGSNFLSGPWESPCRLCVSVHLFPCLSTHGYLFPSVFSFRILSLLPTLSPFTSPSLSPTLLPPPPLPFSTPLYLSASFPQYHLLPKSLTSK